MREVGEPLRPIPSLAPVIFPHTWHQSRPAMVPKVWPEISRRDAVVPAAFQSITAVPR